MSFEFPQTFQEWFQLFPALITLILGAAYFFFPRFMLTSVGLVNIEAHPDAIGEGRSSFAGPLVGLGLVVTLFHDQPVLNALLGLAWALVCVGMIVQMALNERRSGVFILRAAGAAAISVVAFKVAGGYEPLMGEDLSFQLPQGRAGWLPLVSSSVATLFGLVCMLRPQLGLALLRVRPREAGENSSGKYGGHYGGEVRGLLGGFYLAIGATALVFELWQYPYIFKSMIFLTLGACWAMTAFGRMISMLSDNGGTAYNWLKLVVDLALAAMPLLVVFGLIE